MTTTTLTAPRIEIETVTPELAQQWLDSMAPNRKASERRVMFMADQMRNGQWVFDGAPIRFNDKGELVDGQNRLHAVIRAGMSFDFAIVRDLHVDAMAVMDTGKSRTLPDILQMAYPDLTQVQQVAAVTRVFYLYYVMQVRGGALRGSSNRASIPNQVLLDYYGENSEMIIDVTRRARTLYGKMPGITPSAVALAMHLFEELDAEDSEFFFDRYADGVLLEPGSPILALRKRALDAAKEDRRATIQTDESLFLLIKAWNAFRNGDTVQILAWKRGGATPEPFPEPR